MTITKTLKPISIALAVIYANGVYAQTSNLLDDASLTLGTVVVSGASGPISTRNLPTSVDILGAEKIQNQVVTNNWQIFGQMPGIMLTQFNQGNVSGKFSLRGFNGEGEINAVKLLID
ncbi:MAG TPA: TonB-dependent receptor, partial [Methylophaga sp.]|nr:TonB-dependent receptor [Methylophaga sp.]